MRPCTLIFPIINNSRRLLSGIKRLIDIVGSIISIDRFLPNTVIIAVAIKATSKGPVFFKQQRVGQYGKQFTFLKFRSMKVDNDTSVHEEYVRKLIAGQAERDDLQTETVRAFTSLPTTIGSRASAHSCGEAA